MSNIQISEGIKISQIVLAMLQGNEELDEALTKAKTMVCIDALQNCREQGYAYSVYNLKTSETFTWCTYEHRNSDSIIINGKKGMHSRSGELPYKGDKYEYIASFDYNEHYEAAQTLAKEIIQFVEQE
ncbi:MAG: hypothetical protein KJI69_05320 [Patescibacteria group bacterium]|nr:hypothetical protein [Patescibacteria group bacterium]